MGLLEDITLDIGIAFDTDLSDAVSSFTVNHYSSNTFDPTLGSVTRIVENYVIRGVLVEDKEIAEYSVGGTPNALSLLCLLQELSSATIEIGDTLVDSTGKSFTIYERSYDPIKATTTFLLKGDS